MYLANKLDRIAFELDLIGVTAALHADSSRQDRIKKVLIKRRLLPWGVRKMAIGQLALNRYLRYLANPQIKL